MSDVPIPEFDSPRNFPSPSREYRNYDGYRPHPYAFGYVLGYSETVDDRYDEVLSRGTNKMNTEQHLGDPSLRDGLADKRTWFVNIIVNLTVRIRRCLIGPD